LIFIVTEAKSRIFPLRTFKLSENPILQREGRYQ
jgi:hypothetical protein